MKNLILALLLIGLSTTIAVAKRPGTMCWRFKYYPGQPKMTANESYKHYVQREKSGCSWQEIEDSKPPRI